MNRSLLLIAALLCSCALSAQRSKKPQKKPGIPQQTAAAERIAGMADRSSTTGQFQQIPFRSVGPTVMSGRVVDIDVNPLKPSEFYVAYASGGLWHTTNNGTSFSPIFDHEAVMTIGDIAVNWESRTLYVGTGENNSSRSSYSGIGMYKSTNNGQTWEHLGLPESHHIGRIALHPTNPNVLWVAVLGHLYSSNPQRGVYVSEDAGKTWKQTLHVSENAGAIDLIIDPNDIGNLYAATWDRQRRAWDFIEGGTGSGIHHSADGGITWNTITGPESGFPQGAGVGRIGLDLFSQGRTAILYATVDNQDRREPEEDTEEEGLTKHDFEDMSASAFAGLENKALETFLRANNFPSEVDSTAAKEAVEAGELTAHSFFDYLFDANANLFDTPVKGAEIYRMEKDGSWTRTHKEYIDDLVYSYGYYFGQVRVHPNDPTRLYTMGVPLVKSHDGGKEWESISGENVHADHHALWINPNLEGHLINGNDGGINISYDDGETWIKCNNPAVGQFYTVQIDNAEPYNIYGGLQDNGVWKGPSTYEAGDYWHQSGRYPYASLLGGDGMQVEIDPRDNTTLYTGYQFGNYYRINTATDDYHYFQPKHALGERPLRWNWQTPIDLSTHNPDILYMGSNKLHRSMDQGDSWTTISEDLTRGGKPGDVTYGTLTSITESEFAFGQLAVGSDDGLVHVSRDGGASWKQVYSDQSQRWASRVQWSTHEEGRLYIALTGYRWDDFSAHVLVSEDYGHTWSSLSEDLPMEPVNVIREDPRHADILYVGTDHGLYATTDRGQNWEGLGNMPAAPVHDLVLHAGSGDLIVGTHGRSIYVGNTSMLSEWLEEEKPAFMASEIGTVRARGWGNSWSNWADINEAEVNLDYYSGQKQTLSFEWQTADSTSLSTWKMEALPGFGSLLLDMTLSEASAQLLHEQRMEEDPELDALEASDDGNHYIVEGTYRLIIRVNDEEYTQEIVIE